MISKEVFSSIRNDTIRTIHLFRKNTDQVNLIRGSAPKETINIVSNGIPITLTLMGIVIKLENHTPQKN